MDAMPYWDKSMPEEIQEKFHMSKAAFKRALGRLMKEGKIYQEEGWTYIKKRTIEKRTRNSSSFTCFSSLIDDLFSLSIDFFQLGGFFLPSYFFHGEGHCYPSLFYHYQRYAAFIKTPFHHCCSQLVSAGLERSMRRSCNYHAIS